MDDLHGLCKGEHFYLIHDSPIKRCGCLIKQQPDFIH
jgi:hypothetical protein